ncbi:MAG TPA: hypothetical protein VGM03_15230, partial [Phycisphaerae bacterium]
MKVLCLGVALCVVCLPVAAAVAAIYGWDGGGANNLWTTAGNWRGDVVPPPTQNQDIDIRASYLVSPFQTTANWSYATSGTYASISVRANATYGMVLQKTGTGTLNAGALLFVGYDSTRKAALDADQSLTGTSLTAQNAVALDVASGATVDINGSFSVDAINGASLCEKFGAGSLTPDTLYCKSGDTAGEHVTFLISDGNVTVSSATDPLTSIEAANTVDADATLTFDGTGATYDPGTLLLLGGDANPSMPGGEALFDFDAGTLTDPDGVKMYGLSRIDTEQSFVTDTFLVG